MIFEHQKPHQKTKPNIKFSYTSPNTATSVSYRSYFPSQNTKTTAIPQPRSLYMPRIENMVINPQRKKIFDRSYTCKNTLSSILSRQTSNEVYRSKSNFYKQNKQRKPIFAKHKAATRSTDYRNHHENLFQTTYPISSIKHHPLSTINSNALQRQISSLHQSYTAILEQKISPLFQLKSQKSQKSEIKVELSDSATNRSILNSQSYQFPQTQSRFFDKEVFNTQQKYQKLSQVNLYSTTVGSNFNKHNNNARQSLFHGLNKIMKENGIPILLILLGFIILMLQALK